MNSYRDAALRLILPLLARWATVDFFGRDGADFFALAVVDREDERAEEACPPFCAGNPNGSVNSTNSTAAILARIQNSCLKEPDPWELFNLRGRKASEK